MDETKTVATDLAGKVEGWVNTGIEEAVKWSPKVIGAVVGLIIGLIVIGMLAKGADRVMKRAGLDDTLRPFLTSLLSWTLKAALVVALLTTVGIQATSFVAILGAAGLAVGMALQGSLGNFAGGVLILIFRPFKSGDLVKICGEIGVVQEIQIFATIIVTPDNKRVILPNGKVAGDSITNLSAEGHLRVDLVIGIEYDADIRKAREVLMKVMEDDDKVMKDPAPSVNVESLADNSVNLAVRPYATIENYWDVYFGIQEKAKYALDENGIGIPFPQRVVHMADAS